ncbi:MAG TPA: tetratricopeptide repeat protein, partial [Anaerolineae bacterium]|nr:tetratricopeptide repeat protein [Anaerolineae bacterium]
MSKISLRNYVREIESLIEQDRYDEAVEHCKHILEAFPKHIDTYRLLGKAYLESKKYDGAADIFQRVLSAIPDDFISHVGMSFIREDEANLDSAVWHMERAFEIQPYNAAIQNELKRLIGRRDGKEPPKVRLTRGALARMYAKGNLYDQAITELHKALAEDSQRPDLQVVLAEMYAKSGMDTEAIETCSSILNKLPYCYAANKTLVNLLKNTERSDDAIPYKKRLASLNPYEAHVTDNIPNVEDVPDDAITIFKLEWSGESIFDETNERSKWVDSLGDKSHTADKEPGNLPDWLKPINETVPTEPNHSQPKDEDGENNISFRWEESVESENIHEESTPSNQSDNDIPDWMKEAGWASSLGEEEDKHPPLSSESNAEEIEPAELPDWLQNVSTTNVSPDNKQPEKRKTDIPEWLETEENEILEEQPVAGETSKDIPAWLSNIDKSAQPSDEVGGIGQRSEMDTEEEHVPIIQNDELNSLESDTSDSGIEETPQRDIPSEEEKSPGWLEELNAEIDDIEKENKFPSKKRMEPSDGLIGINLPFQDNDLLSSQEDIFDADSNIPAWLNELDFENSDVHELEKSEIETVDLNTGKTLEEAENLTEVRSVKSQVIIEEMETNTGKLNLQDSDVEIFTAKPEEQSLPIDNTKPMFPFPEWLLEYAKPEDLAELQISTNQGVPQETGFGEFFKEPSEDIEAPPWLESISEEQPTSEEATLEEPAQTTETPEWLKEIPEAETAKEEGEEGVLPSEEQEIPSWLESAPEEEPTSEEATLEETAQTTEMPEWLEGISEAETVEEEGEEGVLPSEDIEAPPWLESISEEQPTSEEATLEEPAQTA